MGMQVHPNFWRYVSLLGCLAVLVAAVSQTDKLSCERQNVPRAAQVRFFRAAAAVSYGRQQGDLRLAKVVPTHQARQQLLDLAKAEALYHRKALSLAAQVPPLKCGGAFPTDH